MGIVVALVVCIILSIIIVVVILARRKSRNNLNSDTGFEMKLADKEENSQYMNLSKVTENNGQLSNLQKSSESINKTQYANQSPYANSPTLSEINGTLPKNSQYANSPTSQSQFQQQYANSPVSENKFGNGTTYANIDSMQYANFK